MVWQDLQVIKRRLDNGAVVAPPSPSGDEEKGTRLSAGVLGAFD